ncbi:MAG: hypothetical protein K2X27_02190 [Candidatus Obscuribacterales bacterium]|nr:hypothetical protein [Candidatus Obscuribacterales bacterium]
MERLRLSEEQALCAVLDDEIDETLAAHCERAPVYMPGREKPVYDVIFDVEASNALVIAHQEKMARRKKAEEARRLEKEACVQTWKAGIWERLGTRLIAIAIGLAIGVVYVWLKGIFKF